MIIAIATLTLFAQRSQAEIEARRHNSNYFTPAIERMMRATDAQLLVYAGSLKIEERGTAVGEIVERKLTSAAKTLTKHLDPKVGDKKTKVSLQGLTINALARLGDPVAIPPIRKTLKDGALPIRITSAFALANLNDRESAQGIRALFRYMKEPMLIPLVRKLGEFGDRSAEPTIRGYLEKARYNGLRSVSAEALGSIGNRGVSFSALVEALKDDYPDVRCAAAHSLAKMGDSRAIPALKQALDETSPQASNAPNMEKRSKAAIEDALRALGAG